MELSEFLSYYAAHPQLAAIEKWSTSGVPNLQIGGLLGSARVLVVASLYFKRPFHALMVLDDAEEAGYLYHDLVQLLGNEPVYFLPSSYKTGVKYGQIDSANEILRTEVLNYAVRKEPGIIVTYPDALIEKVIANSALNDCTLTLHAGERVNTDFVISVLIEYGFSRVDFVYEPGQFSVRGSIIDVFSFRSNIRIVSISSATRWKPSVLSILKPSSRKRREARSPLYPT
jgi:Transcription-repair coupling factor (superfamily II helicase)